MKDTDIAIQVRNLNKTFEVYQKEVTTIKERLFYLFRSNPKRALHALKNVNFDIHRGEVVGVIGRNGSGKSTLLKVVAGVYPPDTGSRVQMKGKFMRLSLGLGFNAELTARHNIYINASMLGLTFKTIGRKFDEILKFAELEEFVDTKVKFFSSGMVSRLAFSIALHAEAEIFLLDEFWGGFGDQKFEEKCESVFNRAFTEGKTVLSVTHDMNFIETRCNRAMLIHKGELVMFDHPVKVINAYLQLINS